MPAGYTAPAGSGIHNHRFRTVCIPFEERRFGSYRPLYDIHFIARLSRKQPFRDARPAKVQRAEMLRVLIFLLLLWATPTWARVPQDALEQAMSGTTVPGMGVAIIEGGRLQNVAVRGVREIKSARRVRPNDRWLLNSTVKPMTAALMARLVEEGKLTWIQPLIAMLPDLKGKIKPEYEAITLEEFLSHLAGLAHDVNDVAFLESFLTDRRPLPVQRLSYIIRALNEPPAAKVGTYSYSNTDYIIAAAIVDRISGSPFETILRREIFHPLQMRTASFGSDTEAGLRGHVGGSVAQAADLNPMIFTASGNISMSLADWAKFCSDQLAGAKGKGKLLAAQSYAKMQTIVPNMPDAMPWLVVPSYKGLQGPALVYAGTDGNWFTLVALFPRLGSGALVAANAGDSMGADKAVEAANGASIVAIRYSGFTGQLRGCLVYALIDVRACVCRLFGCLRPKADRP